MDYISLIFTPRKNMKSETVKINPDGTLLLPEELRLRLQDNQELQVAWNDKFMAINYSILPQEKSEFDLKTKIKHFFNQLDKLLIFNEIDPITPDDIETEIAAYRMEKNSQNQS